MATGPATRTSSVVYGLSVLDHRGRVTDLAVLRTLDWPPGTRLHLRPADGPLTIEAHTDGEFSVTEQGHLRICAAARHRHGLATGDRVLLAADPAAGHLLVFPPAVLDDLFADKFTAASGGDSR
ncbi:AbrB/MazE/SpoVT family DNA-binding domain-containing protein [Crossiella sp. CA198]|uniref:AbrB/MazE/SpoVT family DNA-binding domain-containing protein n=1 Tax=Crossiella sp. CA198 TaxID=3455607 RepID=UPI003F8D14B1